MNGRNRQARPSGPRQSVILRPLDQLSACIVDVVICSRVHFQPRMSGWRPGTDDLGGRGSRARHGNTPGSMPTRFAVRP